MEIHLKKVLATCLSASNRYPFTRGSRDFKTLDRSYPFAGNGRVLWQVPVKLATVLCSTF